MFWGAATISVLLPYDAKVKPHAAVNVSNSSLSGLVGYTEPL